MINVLIADDHPLLRAGIRAKLEAEADITVLDEAVDGEDALEKCRIYAPDVLVLDMEMPKINGADVATALKKQGSAIKILALSAHETPNYIFNVLASGAAGYLSKNESLQRILEAVRAVAEGKTGWFSENIQEVLNEKEKYESTKIAINLLSTREKEILRAIASGKSNNEIATNSFISEGTVRKHVSNIFEKIGVSSRTEAAKWVFENLQ